MRLVLFDIDGTLIRTGGAGGRAMARASRAIFDASSTAASIAMPGRTDSWIVAQLAAAARRQFDAQLLAAFRDAYVRFLRHEIHREAPEKGILAGVTDVLAILSGRDDLFLGLLTGNFHRSARLKLEHFGLWHHFREGAFGDDSLDRRELPDVALARVAKRGVIVSALDTIVVGDTPLDLDVAIAGGARAVGVATGPFDINTLRAAGAHVVLPDMQNRGSVVRALCGEHDSSL
jgi:phosphoglycolate phosphatase-like HAD superfamily hydrolase